MILKIINILTHIDEIENKKIKYFEESVKKFRNDKNYKLTINTFLKSTSCSQRIKNDQL